MFQIYLELNNKSIINYSGFRFGVVVTHAGDLSWAVYTVNTYNELSARVTIFRWKIEKL